jgi:hypothetical protein
MRAPLREWHGLSGSLRHGNCPAVFAEQVTPLELACALNKENAMDLDRIDDLTRVLTRVPSRRGVLVGLASALAATLPLALGDEAAAKKRRKHKRKTKKSTPNAFGCLNVGQPCRGKSALCCSGVCGGKKPKQGGRDQRRCIGHNVGGCTPERNFCFADPIQQSLCNPVGAVSVCFSTTGSAGFCGNVAAFVEDENCQLCIKDTDCETAGFPPGSACVVLDPDGINCVDVCDATENRACMLPGI